MVLIVAATVVGTAFLLGVLVGGEVQRHLLRGHEGTRAETLRRQRRRRIEHVRRRQIELYGSPRPQRPEAAPRWSDDEKWWRRHSRDERPVRGSPEGPQRSR